MTKLPHEPKFGIGDVVYLPTMETEQYRAPCPDCKDTKTWQMISPAGIGYLIACPRCAMSFSNLPREYSLKRNRHVGAVRKLTIGSIRYDSSNKPGSDWDSDPFQYMCIETGVGSGSIYNERVLHTDEASALLRAEVMAIERNVKDKQEEELNFPWTKHLDLNSYYLTEAVDGLRTAQIRQVSRAIDRLRETVCEKFREYKEDPENVSHQGLLNDLNEWFHRINHPLHRYDEEVPAYENPYGLYDKPDLKWQE